VTTSTVPSAPSALALPPEDSRTCFINPAGDDLIRRDLHGPDHLDAPMG